MVDDNKTGTDHQEHADRQVSSVGVAVDERLD